jgi:hypothetical protein
LNEDIIVVFCPEQDETPYHPYKDANTANCVLFVYPVLLDDKTVTFSKVKKNKIWVGFRLSFCEHFSKKELQV